MMITSCSKGWVPYWPYRASGIPVLPQCIYLGSHLYWSRSVPYSSHPLRAKIRLIQLNCTLSPVSDDDAEALLGIYAVFKYL